MTKLRVQVLCFPYLQITLLLMIFIFKKKLNQSFFLGNFSWVWKKVINSSWESPNDNRLFSNIWELALWEPIQYLKIWHPAPVYKYEEKFKKWKWKPLCKLFCESRILRVSENFDTHPTLINTMVELVYIQWTANDCWHGT
jgi:hypothetical protein